MGNFSLYNPNFAKIFALKPKSWNFQFTRPQIWKFLVHKTPNLEIFSSYDPFSEATINSNFAKTHVFIKLDISLDTYISFASLVDFLGPEISVKILTKYSIDFMYKTLGSGSTP